jgi:hypothetical protein
VSNRNVNIDSGDLLALICEERMPVVLASLPISSAIVAYSERHTDFPPHNPYMWFKRK